jgi:DNA-binding beta-propeller fold protein YncE
MHALAQLRELEATFPAELSVVSVHSPAGTGVAGLKDGTLELAQFNEPAGLASAAGKLYVADTNNHAIRVIDLAADTVQTLDVRM